MTYLQFPIDNEQLRVSLYCSIVSNTPRHDVVYFLKRHPPCCFFNEGNRALTYSMFGVRH